MSTQGPRRAGAELTDEDVHLFNEGSHDRAYLKLGSHPATREGEDGTAFAVWAPGAARVSVVGEWNGWKPDRHSLRQRDQSGLFEGFVPGVGPGAVYKYHVASRLDGFEVDKADPFAFRHETPPRFARAADSEDLAEGRIDLLSALDPRGAWQVVMAPGSWTLEAGRRAVPKADDGRWPIEGTSVLPLSSGKRLSFVLKAGGKAVRTPTTPE